MEGEAEPAALRPDLGRHAVVEQHVRLVEDRRPLVDLADGVDVALREPLELGVECRAAERDAERKRGARPRLVEEVDSEDRRDVAEVRRGVRPGGRVPVLESDAARARRIPPEVVERHVQRRHGEVVEGEAELRRRRQTAVEHRPVRRALALEAFVVEVLVEVEHRPDALVGQDLGRPRDPGQVAVVVLARARLDRLPDQPQPNGAEPVPGQEPGVVATEADLVRRVRLALVDHVHAVQEQHPTLGVQDPLARRAGSSVVVGGRVVGARRRRRQETGQDCEDGKGEGVSLRMPGQRRGCWRVTPRSNDRARGGRRTLPRSGSRPPTARRPRAPEPDSRARPRSPGPPARRREHWRR